MRAASSCYPHMSIKYIPQMLSVKGAGARHGQEPRREGKNRNSVHVVAQLRELRGLRGDALGLQRDDTPLALTIDVHTHPIGDFVVGDESVPVDDPGVFEELPIQAIPLLGVER